MSCVQNEALTTVRLFLRLDYIFKFSSAKVCMPPLKISLRNRGFHNKNGMNNFYGKLILDVRMNAARVTV